MTTLPSPAGAERSAPKRALLLALKSEGEMDLARLARTLDISKVATLRHLNALEASGLLERSYRPSGVGRPRVAFRLTEASARLFPEAYARMSVCALQFIERSMGRAGVVRMLQERAHEVGDEARGRMAGANLAARVTALARIRDEGGYMAEVGARRRGAVEMLEHNCPILAIAEQYPEACEVERRMFESVLSASVESAHRVVAGDPVCRFLVRPKGSDR